MTVLRKLMLVNVVAIAIVLLIVYMAVEYFAADYFMTLMTMYDISPTSAHELFLTAVYRALGGAALASIAAASMIGYFLTARILRPLQQMNARTRRIAEGDYSGEIEITTEDEVGRLADSFNHMCRALERTDAARRRLILDVAHELRTPVTNIRGYLEAMRDGVILPTPSALESLHEEALRLGAQVEDMLILSRAEAIGAVMVCAPFDLARLIRDLSSLYAPRFSRKGIGLDNSEMPWHLEVVGDERRLAQVLRNLFENAWQYTPQGGEFEISASVDHEEVELCLRNRPVDVPESTLGQLFDRFYRGDNGRNGFEGGAGIGLAIVKEVVAAHGGTVSAEGVGGGLAVRVKLLRQARPATKAA